MSDVHTRLLRETLRGHAAGAGSPECIDTETLAAWSDGTLSMRRRAAVEKHASSCARCQALLAAMVVTAPPASHARWQTSALKWIMPLAAAAAIIAAGISVSRPRRETFQSPVASRQSPVPGSQFPVVGSVPSAAASARIDQTAPPPESGFRRQADVDKDRASVAKRARPANAQKLEQADAPRTEARDASAMAQSVAAPPAVAPPVLPSSSATPAGAPMERAFGARALAAAKAAPLPAQIMSPDPGTRWRIATAGDVHRSIDGGATWQVQSTGVQVTLTAGSAPSPSICWLVGPAGVVLRSTDGSTWERVPFPEAIDLTSVRASDAASATVTAAGGRTFATADGGRTWKATGPIRPPA